MTDPDAIPGAAAPARSPRSKSWRPEFHKGPKQWDAAKAAARPSYPQTPEAYEEQRRAASERMTRQNAAGLMGRQGVPDGWAGRKQEVTAIKAQAALEGAETVHAMKRAGCMLSDDPRAEEALAFVCAVVGDATEPTRTREAAARLVLDFTKARPTSRQEVTMQASLAWLSSLT